MAPEYGRTTSFELMGDLFSCKTTCRWHQRSNGIVATMKLFRKISFLCCLFLAGCSVGIGGGTFNSPDEASRTPWNIVPVDRTPVWNGSTVIPLVDDAPAPRSFSQRIGIIPIDQQNFSGRDTGILPIDVWRAVQSENGIHPIDQRRAPSQNFAIAPIDSVSYAPNDGRITPIDTRAASDRAIAAILPIERALVPQSGLAIYPIDSANYTTSRPIQPIDSRPQRSRAITPIDPPTGRYQIEAFADSPSRSGFEPF